MRSNKKSKRRATRGATRGAITMISLPMPDKNMTN